MLGDDGHAEAPVLQLRFSAQDLLHVRFGSAPAPLLELGLAAASLQRTDSPATFGAWRRQLRHALPVQARALFSLVPPNGAGPLFLDPVSEGLDEGVDSVLASPPGVVAGELRRVCPAYRPVTGWVQALADRDRRAWRTLEGALRSGHRAVLREHWPRVQAGTAADLDWRGRLQRAQGTGAALASLWPGSSWTGSTLNIPYPRSAEVVLSGQGLTLMPSTVWTGQPLLGVDEDGRPLLVYPAVTPLPLIEEPRGPDRLDALLGRTRAAVLRSAAQPRTTTDLAVDLLISPASASQHARTLRESGLLTSTRDGKHVRHLLTPLGRALLG
jgi:DNA-binding transcriptional ArsR family regulator